MIDHLSLAGVSRNGSPCYVMAQRLCQSPGWFLLPGTVETDTCHGPRVRRLSSEHPPFGPKTFPISGPSGASCTGVARYLWLFVCSNPTQFRARLTVRTLKPMLIHLRGLAAECRTPSTFVKCDLANWFWSGQSGVPGGEREQEWTVMEVDAAPHWWTCCYKSSLLSGVNWC